jgi:hypothetical protein
MEITELIPEQRLRLEAAVNEPWACPDSVEAAPVAITLKLSSRREGIVVLILKPLIF